MIRKNLVQSRHDETAGAGEDLISAPDHIIRRADHGLQRPETSPRDVPTASAMPLKQSALLISVSHTLLRSQAPATLLMRLPS